MKILGKMQNARALVIDIDNTVYDNPAYFQDGNRRELEAAAFCLGHTPERLEQLIQSYRSNQEQLTGRKQTVTETMYHYRLSPDQWSRLRCEVWRPEIFLQPNPALADVICKVSTSLRAVAFATNSPKQIGVRVLTCVGLGDLLSSRKIQVFGPEDVGASKHQPEFFRAVAQELSCLPAECVSIGDREDTEGRGAFQAGFGVAVLVVNVGETITLLRALCDNHGGIYGREN